MRQAFTLACRLLSESRRELRAVIYATSCAGCNKHLLLLLYCDLCGQ